MTEPTIILASTSRYRAALLERLLPVFEQVAPEVDENVIEGEAPQMRAERLARAKAQAIAQSRPDALVIGSDQVADLAGHVLDKPGTAEAAEAQLAACSRHTVHFHTAVCVIDTRPASEGVHKYRDLTKVHFRDLTKAEIARYVERDKPLDCAGSFKCEALGISLFERIENQDPTALIGLPLIALARLLRTCGIALP